MKLLTIVSGLPDNMFGFYLAMGFVYLLIVVAFALFVIYYFRRQYFDNIWKEEKGTSVIKDVEKSGEENSYKIRYVRSFQAKVIQLADSEKAYYSDLKNELLSYKGVKVRKNKWKGETFYTGNRALAAITIAKKNVKLFLALNPKEYADSKYKVLDCSGIRKYKKTPLLYIITSKLRVKYSKDLIKAVIGEREKLTEPVVIDYAAKFPFEETEALIKKGLIKVISRKAFSEDHSGDGEQEKDNETETEAATADSE